MTGRGILGIMYGSVHFSGKDVFKSKFSKKKMLIFDGLKIISQNDFIKKETFG